ncbi:MAG: anti-sigma factor [Gaiellaceae bacterium]
MVDDPHLDLGGYVLGRLTPDERTAFERHLAGCARCRDELSELELLPRLLAGAPEPYERPADLWAKTLAAVASAEAEEAGSRPRTPRPRRWWSARAGAVALAGTAAVAAAFAVGIAYEGRDRGPLELNVSLSAPADASVQARARVVKTGIGRVIEFRTAELPILPKGEFYELWFVGARDTETSPNRISAGTFHPDEAGRSHVTFAVDPAEYPILSVTAEPATATRAGPARRCCARRRSRADEPFWGHLAKWRVVKLLRGNHAGTQVSTARDRNRGRGRCARRGAERAREPSCPRRGQLQQRRRLDVLTCASSGNVRRLRRRRDDRHRRGQRR